MKIFVISSCVFPCPPVGYSGLEMLAWQQAEGLAAKGHEVTLAAPDGSRCDRAVVIPTGPPGQHSEEAAYGKYWKLLPEFDAVIDHSWGKMSLQLKAEGRLKAPCLCVCHAPVNTMFSAMPPVDKPCFVCISEDMGGHFRALFGRDCRVAYNGCFAADTLIYPEDGSPETIASYVAREGRGRVLAWDESRRVFMFANVRETMRLPAVNPFAVEIQTSSGLTLTSTPDNPIMTRRGWIAAHEVTLEDEVLCGTVEEVERERGSVFAEELRRGTVRTDRGLLGEVGVVGQWGSSQARTSSAPSPHQGILGGRGIVLTGREIPDEYGRGIGDAPAQTFDQRDSSAGTIAGVEEEEECLVSEDSEAFSIVDPNGGSVLGRNHRWRRIGRDHSGQEKVYSHAVLGGIQYRRPDSRFCEGTSSDPFMVGEALAQQRFGQEPSPDLEDELGRPICRGGVEAYRSLYDGQEAQSRSGHGILPNHFGQGMVVRGWSKVYCPPDQIVHLHQAGKLKTWGQVVSVKRIQTPVEVFDLKTSTGNFIANGIVVHNCNMDFYKPLDVPRSGRFLFLARFSTIKGPDLAIDACRQAGAGLDLVGDTSITNEPEYLEECKRKCDSNHVKVGASLGGGVYSVPKNPICMVGPAQRGECVWWFSQAHALVHPNKIFREPFGLAPVEAMACGCPVIAWDYGAMRETLGPNKGGIVVKSMDELVFWIKDWSVSNVVLAAGSDFRKRCREWAGQFSLPRMIDRYEVLCQEAIETGGW